MKAKDMSNLELMKELEDIYEYFYNNKGCIQNKTRLMRLKTLKTEIVRRMNQTVQ